VSENCQIVALDNYIPRARACRSCKEQWTDYFALLGCSTCIQDAIFGAKAHVECSVVTSGPEDCQDARSRAIVEVGVGSPGGTIAWSTASAALSESSTQTIGAESARDSRGNKLDGSNRKTVWRAAAATGAFIALVALIIGALMYVIRKKKQREDDSGGQGDYVSRRLDGGGTNYSGVVAGAAMDGQTGRGYRPAGPGNAYGGPYGCGRR
jgi:hypothetical protein